MKDLRLSAAVAGLTQRQPGIDLWREYVGWLLCRRALDETALALAPLGIDRSTASALLENAVMYALLKPQAHVRPPALLATLQDVALERGIECVEVGTAPSRRIVDAVRVALKRAMAPAESLLWNMDYPRISTDGNRITAGDFALELSRPVLRAWRWLLEERDAATATELLLRAALRYDAIFAETRHIGPPQVVYDAFYSWGVRNEGFASPFNARLLGRPGARFFSAFADTDAAFGSHGSFFTCGPEARDGAWCLDPPFLPEHLRRVDDAISRMRPDGDGPAIILIVPASHAVANVPDETVRLRTGVHVVEGLGDSFFTLPVDVAIHRYGELPGFSADVISDGYCRPA